MCYFPKYRLEKQLILLLFFTLENINNEMVYRFKKTQENKNDEFWLWGVNCLLSQLAGNDS